MNLAPTRTKLVALGAGVVVTLGGAGIAASSAHAAATTPASASSSTAGPVAPGGAVKPAKPGKAGKHHGHHEAWRLARRVAHADITVQTKTGFVERRVQHGTVTALTGSTLTVKSADAYVSSYTIGSRHPNAAVKVGADVRVVGSVHGQTVTLDRVMTTAELKQRAAQRKAHERVAPRSKQGGSGTGSSTATSPAT